MHPPTTKTLVAAATFVAVVGGVYIHLSAAPRSSAVATIARSSRTVHARTRAGPQLCDYECANTLTDSTGTTFKFDFSSGCSATDYTTSDTVGHNFVFNICRQAKQVCLPKSWTNNVAYGIAVELWGGTPQCPPATCTDPHTGSAACCTADCQILAIGNSSISHNKTEWSLVDPDDLAGGVKVTYHGLRASESDPFWCDFDPSTGQQYPRVVDYVFECDPAHPTPAPFVAKQNTTDDCRYSLTTRWAKACPNLKCVNGVKAPNGTCLCYPHWTGPQCNTTNYDCSTDASQCNTCAQCCEGYDEPTCEACTKAQCPWSGPYTCASDKSTCTSPCPSCCQDYLKSPYDCLQCIENTPNCSSQVQHPASHGTVTATVP